MRYVDTGVDYDAMDPFKVLAQARARRTDRNAERLGVTARAETRGESAFGFVLPDSTICAHVDEGLGTKNLVADAMRKLTGRSFYASIAQDTVAMIVNDLITLGALPVSLSMHLAVGSADWFKDEGRVRDLVEGWGDACDLSGCVWSGGETPTLRDMILPAAAVLAGSAIGIVPYDGELLGPELIQPGDAILFFESSGIHANGLTLARRIAEKLPEGYLTRLSDGRTYGETLLDPTHIYVRVMQVLLKYEMAHYAVNVTGHGWRKLMRAPQPFAYVIEELPMPRPIFGFLQEQGPVDDVEAYGNLNMGAGFAVFLPEDKAESALKLLRAENFPFRAFRAGHVEESPERKVVIRPKEITFRGESLRIRE